MVLDAKKIFADDLISDEDPGLAGKRKNIAFGLGVICILIFAAVMLVFFNVKEKEKDLKKSLEKRLDLIVESRVESVSGWLDGFTEQGSRIFKSELFRWYASNVDLLSTPDFSSLVMGEYVDSQDVSGESGDLSELAAQMPMMKRLLEEFSRFSGFLSARVVNRNGFTYIATDAGTTPLSGEQKEFVKKALAIGVPYFSPVKFSQSGIVVEIYMPIMSLDSKKAVSVFILSKVVTDRLSSILASTPLTKRGERTRLIQLNHDKYQEIVPWLPGDLGLPQRQLEFSEKGDLSFAERIGMDGSKTVYSVGKKVPGIDWWVIQELDAEVAGQEIRVFRRIAFMITFIVAIASGLLLGGVWWRLVGIESRKAASRNYKLAQRIEKQKVFLDSITDSIVEYICLKNNAGSYVFVNETFAKAVGRRPSEMIGLDDTAVFGYDTAKRLSVSDNIVLSEKRVNTVREKVFLQSRLHHVRVTKVPFKDSNGEISGILSVYSDITDLIDAQEKSIKAVNQTIDVLVKTIELRDEYLSGHSTLMKEISSAIAIKAGVGESDVAAVRNAANLSQIGKLFIDRKLLTKPGVLTPGEKKEVEKHVEYAGNILRDIEFDYPVYDAVYQMNEFLDGSGYPKGLKGEDISFNARILAVANAFCAMVKPRVYRPAVPLDRVLAILHESSEKYDQRVVKLLEEVVLSSEGDRILG